MKVIFSRVRCDKNLITPITPGSQFRIGGTSQCYCNTLMRPPSGLLKTTHYVCYLSQDSLMLDMYIVIKTWCILFTITIVN